MAAHNVLDALTASTVAIATIAITGYVYWWLANVTIEMLYSAQWWWE